MSTGAPLRLHGLAQCDSCRKARRWFDARGVAVDFADVRRQPPSAAQLSAWLAAVGSDALLNRRSRTWRELDEAERARDPQTLLAEHPTLMRRPVLTRGDTVVVGVDPDRWQALLD